MRRLFELRTILFVIVLLVTLFLVLYPVLLIIFYSFSSAEAGADFVFGLDAWHRALSEPAMFGSIVNTIKLLVAIHVIAFPVAVLISLDAGTHRHPLARRARVHVLDLVLPAVALGDARLDHVPRSRNTACSTG